MTDITSKVFLPFEGLDDSKHKYKLRPSSTAAVKAVSAVQADRISLDQLSRYQYAESAGRQATGEVIEIATKDKNGIENKKKLLKYDLKDVYNEYFVHAALAQALFLGFPQLIEVDQDGDHIAITITDPKLFDLLDHSVVNKAFLAFKGEQAGTSSTLESLLSILGSVQNTNRG